MIQWYGYSPVTGEARVRFPLAPPSSKGAMGSERTNARVLLLFPGRVGRSFERDLGFGFECGRSSVVERAIVARATRVRFSPVT